MPLGYERGQMFIIQRSNGNIIQVLGTKIRTLRNCSGAAKRVHYECNSWLECRNEDEVREGAQGSQEDYRL
jgi:hypothetical protein